MAEALFPGILGGSSGLHGLPTLSLGGMGPLFPGFCWVLGGIVTCLGVCVYRNWVVEGPLSWILGRQKVLEGKELQNWGGRRPSLGFWVGNGVLEG